MIEKNIIESLISHKLMDDNLDIQQQKRVIILLTGKLNKLIEDTLDKIYKECVKEVKDENE